MPTSRPSTSYPPPATDLHVSHIPALDGLRGVAVAGVLLFHTGHVPGGFLGVDLFFVLSGFLITRLLLREMNTTGRVSLPSFWGRRLRRLFPASALVLSVVAVTVWALQRFGYIITDRGMVSTTLADALWAQLNLVNWHLLAQDASYWDAFGQSRVFEHLWSIAVEEQFYLAWPLIIGAVAWTQTQIRRRVVGNADIAVLAVTITISAVSLALMVALRDPVDPTRAYTGTDTRAFSLLLGAAVATGPARRAFHHVAERYRRVAAWVIGALAVGILAFWRLADGTATPGLFVGGLFAHALACAVLIGLAAAVTTVQAHDELGTTCPPWPLRVLQAHPLAWLGGISYSLYLWHWPLIVLFPAHEHPGPSHWWHSAVIIGMSIVLAAVSKHLVEDPIRFRARWARGRTGMAVFLVVSAALLTMWLTLPEPAAPSIDIGEL